MSDKVKPKRKRLIAALELAVETLERIDSKDDRDEATDIDYAIAVAVEALRSGVAKD